MSLRRTLPFAVLAAVFSLGLASCKNPSGPDGSLPPLPPVQPGTVLLQDEFDTENQGRGHLGRGGENNYTAFANWNVTAGCVDLHGNGFWDVQSGNGLYVDLDGSCNRGGTIESKTEFPLAPGSYVLEFYLAGNQRIDTPDTVQVALGSVFSEQFVMNRRDAFRLISRTIAVSNQTTARLSFRNLGGDEQGALLDRVRLRRSQQP